VAAGAFVRVDGSAHLHDFLIRLDAGLRFTLALGRLIFQINRDGFQVGIGHV